MDITLYFSRESRKQKRSDLQDGISRGDLIIIGTENVINDKRNILLPNLIHFVQNVFIRSVHARHYYNRTNIRTIYSTRTRELYYRN